MDILRKMPIFLAVGALFVMTLILLYSGISINSITGFAPSELNIESVNLTVDKSRSHMIQSTEPIKLKSVSLSGGITGDGAVNVYVEGRNGERFLVYSNKAERKGLTPITGLIHKAEEGGTEKIENFNDRCIETCLLPESEATEYRLFFEVEPGTVLQVDEIIYTRE